MSDTRHSLVAIASAALQLALSLGLTADLVVCTATSGHAAVESAYSADCCDDHLLPEGVRADDDCGCVDTPILQSPVEVRQKSEYAPPSPQAPAFQSLDLARLLLQSAPPAPRSSTAEWAPTVRRSVVLLV